MALNMDKVRNKLASFDKSKKGGKKATPSENQEKVKKYIWKPEPGKQVIRVVPYQFQPDFPFIELKWHYDFNGDKVNYLSPASQNKPDPIVELANRLEKVRETWAKGRKLQPKLRTYVPIVVRGKEEEGVKFWGFGVQVCEQLMAAINEPEYGDITDLVNGYDIQVDFKTAEEVKKDFPETKILIKPTRRPVIDPENPKAREILELITKKQINIFDIFTPASYDELAAALETKIQAEERGVSAASAPRGAERVAAAAAEQAAEVTTSVPVAEVKAPAQSPSLEKSKQTEIEAEDFDAAFANIFNSKK
jgi:gp32 DNA binding protein like